MKIKIGFLLILTAFCCLAGWGQKSARTPKIEAQEITIKKQIIVDNLESQIKDIPFAAVRVFVRSKIAAWLWKDGKDDTGRAEQLAVKAINELYENKTEIPSPHFHSLKSETLALLASNAKETAKKLITKYDVSSEDELESANLLLNKKDGEKLAVSKIKESLVSQSELSPIVTILIDQLESRKLSELVTVLNTIINLAETGRNDFSTDALYLIVHNFRSPIVSNDLRIRFYKIVLKKAGDSFQSANSNAETAYYLLNAVMPDIATNAPDFLAEASALRAALTTRLSQAAIEERERNKRIEANPDKLDALISEAEKSDDKGMKYHLYSRAAALALEQEKYRLAVDLIEKTMLGELPTPETFRYLPHDQFLGEVARNALKKDDTDAAKYAVRRVIDELSRADILRKTAVYYFEKQDLISATDSFNEALKLTNNANSDTRKIYNLFGLLFAIQKIDKSRLAEVTAKTAKTINDIPALNIDDKPGTANYKKYVALVMTTNWNLLPFISQLAKENKNEAIYFTDRINKREIKIIADFALSADSLEVEKKPIGLK